MMMRLLLPVAVLLWAQPIGATEDCIDCHPREAAEFATTAMASSALGSVFQTEAGHSDTPEHCHACHAPSGGDGVACVDCHVGKHPYPVVQAPAACARCHDAPSETTVQRFAESAASKRGEGCLDCHTKSREGAFSHAFLGPKRPGFLDDVAQVSLFLRQESENSLTGIVRIQHRAGHSLPGGTVGRAVWLIVTGLDETGATTWTTTRRFGWHGHGLGAALEDHTLPPNEPAIVEVENVDRNRTAELRADLIYRFRPEGLETPDPRERTLDTATLRLPDVHVQK